ncbi:MAG: hypothetical protein ACKVHU_20400 [Acidimicrobiales bacterium]
MTTFLEGIDASFQPCTLALLLPAFMLVLAAGRWALASWPSFVLGAAIMFWSRAAGYWGLENSRSVALVIAVFVIAVYYAMWKGDDAGTSAATGLGVGAVAGWLWLPCVGTQLGIIINEAGRSGLRTLGMTVIYVAGAALAAGLVAVIPLALPRTAHRFDRPAVRAVGFVWAGAYAVLIAVGKYDAVVGELLRRSTA